MEMNRIVSNLRALRIKRDQSKAENFSETRIESISSQLSLKEEEIIVKVQPTDMRFKPEIMDELSKKIGAMGNKLDNANV